ncbi:MULTISPECIES: LpqN/LpqT family lipoprotein [unclassified Mycobacterium]|uniref:LpqN/LpqT family lipoprotein n=1 Tax=unclassified Mycobacterium TaxID=2642494 RepID=UPI0029C7C9EC|nr:MULTISPECIES: LpqN/LpqT family lipoprotein [unclassified Mycobacterium]
MDRPGGRVIVASFAVVAFVATGCARAIDGHAVAAGPPGEFDDSQCTKVDAPMETIPHAAGAPDEAEPTLRTARPDGWKRITELDSAMIRFAVANPALGVGDFAASAVVTMDSDPGDVAPEEIFDDAARQLVSGLGATDVEVSDGTLCGLPAHTVHYKMPRPNGESLLDATAVVTVVPGSDKTWAVAITIQSPRPDDPKYQQDLHDITTGFQVLAPDSGRR